MSGDVPDTSNTKDAQNTDAQNTDAQNTDAQNTDAQNTDAQNTDTIHKPIHKESSNMMLKGLVVAIAAAAFFAGYSVSTFTDQPPGISDEQMDLILSEIDSKMPVPIPANDNAGQNNPIVRVSLDDDPMKGNPDAIVTIVEFSDFQCPFCARFYDQTLPLIERDYISTGKVNFVYRDFPLQSHQNAMATHMAAECADEQDAFWAYHDILFERQREWGPLPQDAVVMQLLQYADGLGLQPDEFESCMSSGAFAEEVQKDYQDGAQYGVRGTPAFFIGNDHDGYMLLSGAQPYTAFQAAIESRLG